MAISERIIHTPTARLAALRDEIMVRKGSWIPEHHPFAADVALWRASRPGFSVVQIRAAFLREYVALAPVAIYSGWRLAGEHVIPESWHPQFHLLDPAYAEQRRRLADFGIVPEQYNELERRVAQWTERGTTLLSTIGEPLVSAHPCIGWSDQAPVFWGSGWMENHSIRDYARVLRDGFAGIRRDVAARMAQAEIDDPGYPQAENFWRAAQAVCDAGILLGQRYAALAAEMADGTADPAERARLRAMAEACARVPAEGARTFFEAVQALWLSHILTCAEDGINANSLGRVDQLLYPYYQADIAAGRLTADDARELLAEFACKLYLEYDVQAITLGGVTAGGDDAVNELSYLMLEATREVDFIRDLSVRVTSTTPEPFINQCAELIVRGGGIPFIFNDECFIPALVEHGIPLHDARDYAPIGCVELTIPGKANPHAVSGWFNAAKCLELALFDGFDHHSGRQLGPHTGLLTDHPTFAAFFAAYRAQVAHFAPLMCYTINRGELAQRERGPLPCWSTLTDDCIPRGRDITDSGARYNYHSICFLGTANVADSLMALNVLVYDQQQVDAGELLTALRRNFADDEPLRLRLVHGAPKYGNDVSAVDALAREVADQFIDLMDRATSPLGGRYVVHLFSFLSNIAFGKMLGATPDGRRAGEPIAYSLSAQQGRDISGITALFHSLARLPHHRAAGASAAIVEVDPKVVAGSDGVTRMGQLIRTAVALGIGQLQWNVTTAERLLQAQQDPERYGNLPVRVAGYSQMFKLLDRDLQNHIIARTKHQR